MSFKVLNIYPSLLIYQESREDILQKSERDIIIVNFYIYNFLHDSKDRKLVDQIKKKHINKDNFKDIGNLRTIIRQKVIWNLETKVLKIYQSIFI